MAEGLTAKFVDFGFQSRWLTYYAPVDVEMYPDQGMQVSKTTASEELTLKLYTETAEILDTLKKNPTWVLPTGAVGA